jgi:hypothetical protein
MDMLLELLLCSTTLFLWCSYWFFSCCSLDSFLPFFLIIKLDLFLKFIFRGMFLRGTQRLHFWTKFWILLILMISWVHLCVSKSWVPKYLLTNPLGSKTWTYLSLSLITCRMEVFRWRIWALTISIFFLECLRYGWFSISLFMAVNSHVVMWHLHLLCELSHTLYFMLMSNMKFVHVLTWSL